MSSNNHKQSFWTKYIWSTDHKVIGIQYGITSLIWLLFGFALMMIMRYQLAYPESPVPFVGNLLGEGGILPSEMYNSIRGNAWNYYDLFRCSPISIWCFRKLFCSFANWCN